MSDVTKDLEDLHSTSDPVLKKACFSVKTKLKDEKYAKEFCSKDGVKALEKVIENSKGNMLAYALGAVQTLLATLSDVHPDETLLVRITDCMFDANLNASKCALTIVNQLTKPETTKGNIASNLFSSIQKVATNSTSPTYSVTPMEHFRKHKLELPYDKMITLLLSADVSVKTEAIAILNNLLSSLTSEERATGQFHSLLVHRGVNSTLESLRDTQSKEVQYELYKYQVNLLLHEGRDRNIDFSENEESHINMLKSLWASIYPDDSWPGLVFEQWKTFGFTSQYPRLEKDVKGASLMGWRLFVYFAEHHSTKLKGFMEDNMDKEPDERYSVVLMGFHITYMMQKLFKIGESVNSDGPFNIYPILFLSQDAFSELYCTIFEILDEKFQILTGSSEKTIKKELRSTVEVILSSNPRSVAEFRKLALLDVVKPRMKGTKKTTPSLHKAYSSSGMPVTPRQETHHVAPSPETSSPVLSPRITPRGPSTGVHGITKRATNDALLGEMAEFRKNRGLVPVRTAWKDSDVVSEPTPIPKPLATTTKPISPRLSEQLSPRTAEATKSSPRESTKISPRESTKVSPRESTKSSPRSEPGSLSPRPEPVKPASPRLSEEDTSTKITDSPAVVEDTSNSGKTIAEWAPVRHSSRIPQHLIFSSSSPRSTFGSEPSIGLPIIPPGSIRGSGDSFSSGSDISSPRSYNSDVGSPSVNHIFRLDLNTPTGSPSTPRASNILDNSVNIKPKGVFDPDKATRVRNEVIKEIITTERDYVNDLHTIYEVFLIPMKFKYMLSNEDISMIFNNLEAITICGEQVLKDWDAKRTTTNDDIAVLCEVFHRMSPYFKIYTTYCANQCDSMLRLEEHKKKPDFLQLLSTCEKDPRCKGLTLGSFLIKPIQRVCKYPLLFRELLRNTSPDDSKYGDLKETLDRIEKATASINEGKRQAERLRRVADIQDSLYGAKDLNLVQMGRSLLREGPMNVVTGTDEYKDHYVFMFNDLFLITKQKAATIFSKEGYDFKGKAMLEESKIINISDTDTMKNAFEIFVPPKKKYTFCAPTPEEKDTWLKNLKSLKKEFQKKDLKQSSSRNLLAGSKE